MKKFGFPPSERERGTLRNFRFPAPTSGSQKLHQNLDPLTAVKCIRKPDFRNLVPVILDLSVAGHRYRPAREHILWKHVSTDELINYV